MVDRSREPLIYSPKTGSEEGDGAGDIRGVGVRGEEEDDARRERFLGYDKVCYRGLHKNKQRIALLLGFTNLLIAERSLAA